MIGNDSSFNLVSEPWIRTQDIDGAERLVSLSELFAMSQHLRTVLGDTAAQSFAITRVLLAIVRRAVEWGERPIARWQSIWESGSFPTEQITGYLDRFHRRFDLLDSVEPFYQVADLATAKAEFRPVELLLEDVPTGEKYFTTRVGPGTESLSLAEAARWLIHCQAYDISGIKSGDPRDPRTKGGKGYPIGVGWVGQLGGVLLEGENLFQTLMMNTVASDTDGNGPDEDDLPVWEMPHPDCCERDLLVPTGPADLLTWQSRRIRLVVGDGQVRSVLIANGDPLDSHNRFRDELMTSWRFSEPQSKKFGEDRFLPMQWDPDRVLWRGIEGLLGYRPAESGPRPGPIAAGSVHWVERLFADDVLAANTRVRIHAYGLEYINQSSFVRAAVDDALSMSIAVLEHNGDACTQACQAVERAVKAVRALGVLSFRLARAAGGDGVSDRASAEADGYFALDGHYRHWLGQLSDTPDADHRADWDKAVRRVVEPFAKELLENAGEVAWIGRENHGQWGEFKGAWLDSAVAESAFRRALINAIPRAYEESDSKSEAK